MNANPQRPAGLKSAVITGIACIAVFISQVEAQNAPYPPATGSQEELPNAPDPPATVISPSVQPRPAASGETRLDAMGPTEACREMRPITAVETNIGVNSGSSERPEDVGSVCHPAQAEPLYAMTARPWAPTCYFWEAPSLCYGPLYFEETNLERYGYSQKYLRGVQPLVSSAHFFGTVAMLPYLEIVEPSRECVYTLGQYRPGDCVPFQWEYPYFSPCARWPLTCDK